VGHSGKSGCQLTNNLDAALSLQYGDHPNLPHCSMSGSIMLDAAEHNMRTGTPDNPKLAVTSACTQ
jgi:hypothetical protein